MLVTGMWSCLQVGIQAYIMWEKAGKPDGADFSNDACNILREQLQSGAAVQVLGATC